NAGGDLGQGGDLQQPFGIADDAAEVVAGELVQQRPSAVDIAGLEPEQRGLGADGRSPLEVAVVLEQLGLPGDRRDVTAVAGDRRQKGVLEGHYVWLRGLGARGDEYGDELGSAGGVPAQQGGHAETRRREEADARRP